MVLGRPMYAWKFAHAGTFSSAVRVPRDAVRGEPAAAHARLDHADVELGAEVAEPVTGEGLPGKHAGRGEDAGHGVVSALCGGASREVRGQVVVGVMDLVAAHLPEQRVNVAEVAWRGSMRAAGPSGCTATAAVPKTKPSAAMAGMRRRLNIIPPMDPWRLSCSCSQGRASRSGRL